MRNRFGKILEILILQPLFHCKLTFWLQKSGDYLAIPITVNVVLIISDTLLIWASASKNKLLLWPWIILHCLEFLFFIAMLILLMVIVDEPWFKGRFKNGLTHNIDVLWRPKTLGIHFVARLFQKITKNFWRFWHLLSNKLVKIIWEQNECLP